jgi:hypothetical protein
MLGGGLLIRAKTRGHREQATCGHAYPTPSPGIEASIDHRFSPSRVE